MENQVLLPIFYLSHCKANVESGNSNATNHSNINIKSGYFKVEFTGVYNSMQGGNGVGLLFADLRLFYLAAGYTNYQEQGTKKLLHDWNFGRY
jgi:hypothetical protein